VGSSTDQITDEMRAVKRMIARLMCQQKMQPGNEARPPDMPDKLFDQYLGLLEQEVAEELAQKIIEQVGARTKEQGLDNDAALDKALRQVVADLIPTDEGDGRFQPTEDGRPRTIALVGPTGVGKTTTVAKLAANFKLKQKRSVGLITLDTYRIAAVDQLKTYADIIGVPLHVVTTPQEMVEVDRLCRDCEVILIDTAGRSQRDDPKLEQLASFIVAARPHEVHLVLSSTCTQKVIFDTVERFSRIRTDRIIFTKLDETVNFGVLVNVAQKVNKRLSFLTTGQEVPHQIEPGTGDRIAALVLGHEAVDGPLVTVGGGVPVSPAE
jgi:flagellar biosynthesis protein FlhF